MTEYPDPQPLPGELRDPLPGPESTFLERHGISPVLFAYLSLALIFLLYQILGGGLTILLFGLKPTVDNAQGFRIITGVAQICFILIPTLVLARLASPAPFKLLGIRKPGARLILPAIAGMLSLQQLMQILLTLQDRLPVPDAVQRFSEQFRAAIEEAYRLLVGSATVPELLFVLVIVACIPSIVEELLFRGLIMNSLQAKLSPIRSAVITGIIFGAYHMNPFGFVGLAAIGIYLGILATRSRSVVLAMVAHFVNNAVAVIAMYAGVSDAWIVTGDAALMSSGELLGTSLPLLALFVASIVWFYRLTRVPEPASPEASV